jgi:hypothetical protein
VSRSLLILGLFFGLAARAEDERSRRAREELETQLSQLVDDQPTRVRVDFVALDEPNYALRDVAFELDGKPLPAPATSALAVDGQHLVWEGDVRPGKHGVRARITYQNQASIVVSDEGGYAWKVSGEVSFEVQRGLEVQVRVVPTRDPGQRDIARRLRLALPAAPVMLARLDDGSMPEPPHPRAPVAEGAPVVASAVGGPASLREPGKHPRAERPAPRAPPALGSSGAAGPTAEPGVAAPLAEAAPALAPSSAPPAPPPDELAAARPRPQAPTEPVAEAGELPWALLGGLGVALVVALALLARWRSRPPTVGE